MEPGDEVICSYEEYTKFKQLALNNNLLQAKLIHLETQITLLNHKIDSTERKFINKNALLVKEQLKVECLVLLLDDIRTALNIKPQTIGHGFKEIKGMDESSKFSVLRASFDKTDIEERLPENFSKPNTYMEICTEFQSYKALAELIQSEWKEKLKTIQYLEKEIETSVKGKQQQDRDQSRPVVLETEEKEKQRVILLEKEVSELKRKLQTYEIKYKKAVEKHSQEAATLRTQIMHVEEQLLARTKALQLAEKQSKDAKTKLMNCITEYIISVSEGMMMLSLTAHDKKAIVERQIKDVEDLFKQSVKQLYI